MRQCLVAHEVAQYNVNTDCLFTIAGSQTAMVIVSLDETGERSFGFYRHNTADVLLTQAHLAQINWQSISSLPFALCTLHFALQCGSKACLAKGAFSALPVLADVL